MKHFCQYSFAAALFILSVLLFCFVSCQSNDNVKTVEGASVASLPLTSQIGDTSSRVGITGTYGGTFSCYWNSDKLNVYHKYILNGATQYMMSLPFTTSVTSGTSASFSYTGGYGYFYNPGARLYAFSSNTSGGYTTSVTDAGVSTLTASTLASQSGTLSDCAKYDALYGNTVVNSSTGLPGPLAMHHLFGMLNFHLTSSTFSTSYPVTVTLNSSAPNIFPGNGGSSSLAVDGSMLTQTGSWNSSWSATITPTTNGVVDVYLMTWPFSTINGTFTVSCSDGTGNTYVARSITLSGFSLAAAQLKSKLIAITNITPNSYSSVYAWDAIDYKPATVGTVPTNANYTTVASSESDYSGRAIYICKKCPNYNEIGWYLSVQYYWDNGSITGGNTTNFKLPDGSTVKAGMWFRKKSGIPGFSSDHAFTGTMISNSQKLSDMTAAAISALNLSVNYFFLPAGGYLACWNGGYFVNVGSYGRYWSSTPETDSGVTYDLGFNSDSAGSLAFPEGNYRNNGFYLWQGQ